MEKESQLQEHSKRLSKREEEEHTASSSSKKKERYRKRIQRDHQKDIRKANSEYSETKAAVFKETVTKNGEGETEHFEEKVADTAADIPKDAKKRKRLQTGEEKKRYKEDATVESNKHRFQEGSVKRTLQFDSKNKQSETAEKKITRKKYKRKNASRLYFETAEMAKKPADAFAASVSSVDENEDKKDDNVAVQAADKSVDAAFSAGGVAVRRIQNSKIRHDIRKEHKISKLQFESYEKSNAKTEENPKDGRKMTTSSVYEEKNSTTGKNYYHERTHAERAHVEKTYVERPHADAGNRVEGAEGKKKSKAIQKRELKKAYASAYRERGTENAVSMMPKSIRRIFGMDTAKEEAKKAVGDTLKEKVKELFSKHIGLILILAVIALLVMLLVSSLGMLGMAFGEAGAGIAESTYLSSDSDILDSDAAYCDMERELERRINRIPSSHPGFDEYRYQLDEISHDPYALTSYLTAIFGNYKFGDIGFALDDLFREQFSLTLHAVTETRTRVETDTDPETGLSYSYLVEYDWHVLVVKLKNKGLDAIAMDRMNEEQKRRYEIYQASSGNRAYLFGENVAIGNVAAGGISYDIPPEALNDASFARMIHEAEKYLGYPYVWGGSSPATSFDCSGFVSYVINHSGNGWNVGRSTANGLLTHCTYVSPSDAKPGDLIFFQGTYNTSGASHVGIYVGNGMMIHCGNPIQYASVNTNYWRSHFLCYGRIR